MGQLKLTPRTNVLSLPARARAGEAAVHGPTKANGFRPGAIEPPLPLTPQRLELIKAYAKNRSRNAQAPTASEIAQRFAPRAEEAPPPSDAEPAPPALPSAPFSMLASGIRRLTAVLVIAALLPNLTLAAFWLRLIEPPWSQPVMLPSQIPAAAPELPLPVLSAPAALEVTAGEDVALPIALDGTDGVPAGSVIVIRGLPPGVSLSSGRPHGAANWTLRPGEIGDLHLTVAGAGSSESELTIQLLAPNNGVIAEATTKLEIRPAAAAPDARPAQMQDPDAPVQEPGAAAAEESVANTDEATSMSEPVPLPTRRPTPSANDTGPANWIRPSAYVNLREGPSSSARVVSVVAKGTKLRIVAQKRGWVQVADPATSQSGWIYSGNVEALP
jgi:hypothetical protein